MNKTDKFKSPDESVIKKDTMRIVTIGSALLLLGIVAILYFLYVFNSNSTISESSLKNKPTRNINEYLDSVYKDKSNVAVPEKYDENEVRIVMTDEQLYNYATRKKDNVDIIRFKVGYEITLDEVAGKIFNALNQMSISTVKTEEKDKIIFESNYHVGYNGKAKCVVNFKYSVEIARDNPKSIELKYHYHNNENTKNEDLQDSYTFFSDVLVAGILNTFKQN